MLFAMVSYFGAIAVPEQRVNQGMLVDPQQPPFELRLRDGQVFEAQGRWQLLLFVTACDGACRQWQHQLTQLHTLLGRDRDRVGYQLVMPSAAAQLSASDTAPASEINTEHTAIPLFSPQATPEIQGLWLVDPLGNRVLRYRLDQPAKAVLKDLKRLLKVSRIG
ncbi:hypothetical protein DV711_02740 [Motiliproteus coralliicola]|uniref:Thioredoxin domain-containing protein n=1 Tax=Motiliproteus coralliicola TaxID=2283196 RepID=A0A369WS64_9GAMM|nr:hypothetical protein DV711_02740 [Motiliproteus coralliicola]